jgi:ABC-type antimicrobial peptide transport system permease subunit
LADSDWLIVGLVIGVLVGIPLGWIIAQAFAKQAPSSVVFERDREGRITGLHYVPGVKG